MEAGKLEIYTFLPEQVLKDADFDAMGIDEFLTYLARARYVEEQLETMHADAIRMALHPEST